MQEPPLARRSPSSNGQPFTEIARGTEADAERAPDTVHAAAPA
ncbi:hypothetical protein [Streptomyces sp. NPDC048496]